LKIKVFGVEVRVKMPVWLMGYAICPKIFNLNLLSITQTGFLIIRNAGRQEKTILNSPVFLASLL
jgi:hypothetical protein